MSAKVSRYRFFKLAGVCTSATKASTSSSSSMSRVCASADIIRWFRTRNSSASQSSTLRRRRFAISTTITRAALVVVSAVALAEIVEHHREEQQLGPIALAHDLGQQRTVLLVRALADSLELADADERVLVDRVDVVEIVLDHAEQASELRNQAPEHTEPIHLAERSIDAVVRLQHRHEDVDRTVGSRDLVGQPLDVPAHRLARPGRKRDGAALRVLEDREQIHRVLFEDLLVDDELAARDRYALAELSAGEPAQDAGRIGRRGQAREEIARRPRDDRRVRVVLAHEHFGRAMRRGADACRSARRCAPDSRTRACPA